MTRSAVDAIVLQGELETGARKVRFYISFSLVTLCGNPGVFSPLANCLSYGGFSLFPKPFLFACLTSARQIRDFEFVLCGAIDY